MNKFLTCAVGLSLLLGGCATPQKINYSLTSVPEEGGIKFTQFTRDDEKVLGPYIAKTATNIQWYAPPLIAISPDGNSVAYLARQNDADNIYIKSTLGGKSTIQRTFRNNVFDMAYSPDGKNIAFTDRVSGNSNVYLINASEGVAVQQITSTMADEVGPCFSPDGKEIYFTKTETTTQANGLPQSRYYIWSYNRETSLLTQYSEGFTPNITPDGKNLIITRNNKQNGKGEIWIVNTENGQETMILNDPSKGFSSPRISPDGKKIICVGTSEKTKNRNANLDLFVVNLNGTGLTQLTFHPGDDVSPQWSPDGKILYFLSQRGTEKGSWNVWKMDYKL